MPTGQSWSGWQAVSRRWRRRSCAPAPGRLALPHDDGVGQLRCDHVSAAKILKKSVLLLRTSVDKPTVEFTVAARLRSLFAGFETVNAANLSAQRKFQNIDRDYQGGVRRLHDLGVMVNARRQVHRRPDPEARRDIPEGSLVSRCSLPASIHIRLAKVKKKGSHRSRQEPGPEPVTPRSECSYSRVGGTWRAHPGRSSHDAGMAGLVPKYNVT